MHCICSTLAAAKALCHRLAVEAGACRWSRYPAPPAAKASRRAGQTEAPMRPKSVSSCGAVFARRRQPERREEAASNSRSARRREAAPTPRITTMDKSYGSGGAHTSSTTRTPSRSTKSHLMAAVGLHPPRGPQVRASAAVRRAAARISMYRLCLLLWPRDDALDGAGNGLHVRYFCTTVGYGLPTGRI